MKIQNKFLFSLLAGHEGEVMKKALWISVCLLFVITSIAESRQAPKGINPANKQPRVQTQSVLDMDRPLDEDELFSSVQADTFLLGEWTFESGSACVPEGWTSVDLTMQNGCYWHIADGIELDGGDYGRLNVLSGNQSLWCGVMPDPNDDVLCGYAILPGYGNGWDQGWCMRCIEVPDTEEVYIEYQIAWDSEPGYDYTYVEYATKSTCDSLTHPDFIRGRDWIELAMYDNIGTATVSDTIPDTRKDNIKIRFHFTSDPAWSDEDGLWNTDGAVILDDLVVRTNTMTYDSEDFEYNAGEGGENPGDTQTADNDWECCVLTGYGDFSGIYHGLALLQEDPCIRNLTCMWSFINGSTIDYACSGHPEQLVVPYVNSRGQYINNEIWSPQLDWIGSGSETNLEFDVYRDLWLNGLIFYIWHIRSIDASGCPGSWKDRGWVYYGGNKDWIRPLQPVGDLISPTADKVQIALGVIDMCPWWCIVYGGYPCHSQSPMFDNVELYRVAQSGPQWSVRDIDLFQDTFPENGTSIGTGRIDMAQDILPSSSWNIHPGDSAKVLVSDPEAGLANDAYTGFGPSVYFYVKRNPGPSVKPIATTKVEEDAFRWPLVDSVMAGGEKWYMFRMDTCCTEPAGPRTGPVQDAYCIDINDHYFTNGDTIWFFFGAHNASNEWTWWSQFTGMVYSIEDITRYRFRMEGGFHGEMEMQILPGEGIANGRGILYVDNFSGRGAQPYFDSVFQMFGVWDEIDRFDKRGPSSLVGNSLGYHATVAQLHSSYRHIIWNSGDLSVGTVGDGAVEKADDYALLFAFLDLHPNVNGAGIYFSGDDLAQELDGMTSASSQQFKNVYMPHALVTGNHATIHRISPYGIGEGAGTGVPPSVGIFDHGPPFGVDTLIAYGGCPIINDFDVIAPVGLATLEMCYDPARPVDDSNPAIVAFDTLNSSGFRVATVLSGFSFHCIRDDLPKGLVDRADHFWHIMLYLGTLLDSYCPVESSTPSSNSLAQNYPNPFNPSTTIKYSVKEKAHVSLKIYNVAGQLVRTLVNGDMNAGAYTETWNGRSNSGNTVSSGVYFYKLVTKNFSITKKMVLLK
jgi:hypothetical protein